MCQIKNANSLLCNLNSIQLVNDTAFILNITWNGQPPKAGQFFMIKPERSTVLLPRPISIFEYNPENKNILFLIYKTGKGTHELSRLLPGEKISLLGPLGNSWEDFLPETIHNGSGKAGLVGGSAGVAPLAALVAEKPDYNFNFFAGFKNGFNSGEEEAAILGSGAKAGKLIITAEDGKNALHGKVTDYLFDLESYSVIFACGSLPLLISVKKKCESKNVPCFLSMESRMACGVGACLGCSIKTVNGNRRLCADGPIFSSKEVLI